MSKKIQTKNKQHKKNNKSTKHFGTTIPNQLYAITFPREQKVVMRYHELRSFTTSAAVANDYMFNLNSIYDPNYSAAGHQPLGYDQWAAFYGRYRVDGCKVTVTTSYTSGDSAMITLLGNNSVTSVTNPDTAAESPITATKSYSKGGPPTIIIKNFNLADLNGVTRKVYETDDRYQAQFAADPTEKIMLHVVTSDIALASSIIIHQTVLLEYSVTMFDPVQQVIS